MTYRSLYRKWRPLTFEEVVGQEVASRLLTSALKSGHINHAYLFCGPRGVGKTTTARILARSVNCAKGITDRPCGTCSSCLRIIEGNSLDCVEIDAASHRGIDDIRELREKVKYSPLESRYKVYIIDEVHMLTTEAFNALLKTLEEPPDHAIFILATTEPQRLPDTILSRCLRINFNAIGNETMVHHLQKITVQEGFQVEEDALYLAARKADGSLRDGVSFLEQLMSWGEKNISYKQAILVLREVDQNDIDSLYKLLCEGNQGKALLTINEWVLHGLDPEDIVRSLVHYFRSFLVLSLIQSDQVYGISPHRIQIQRELMKSTSFNALRETMQRLHTLELEMKRSSHPQILLELALLDIIDSLKKQQPMTPSEKVRPKANQISDRESPILKPSSPITNPEPKDDKDWDTLLQRLKKKKISLYAFLQEAELRESENAKLILAFGPNGRFHKESIERKENFQIVVDVLKEIKGNECQLECIIDESNSSEEGAQNKSDSLDKDFPHVFQKSEDIIAPKQEKNNDQINLFSAAVEIFNGLVVEYSSQEDHFKIGWEEIDLEKPDEGSSENAG